MSDQEAEAAVLAAEDKLESCEVDGTGKTISRSIFSPSVGKRIVYIHNGNGEQTGFSVEDV